MKLSKEGRKIAKALFRASFSNDRLDLERVRAISNEIVASRPRQLLQLFREYTRLVRLEVEKRHAVIESAETLAPETQASVAGSICARFGADVTTEFHVNPALIGGIRFQIGSDVWDGSISNRLELLKQQL